MGDSEGWFSTGKQGLDDEGPSKPSSLSGVGGTF